MFEPWEYTSVRKANKWFLENMEPKINALILLLNQRDYKGWQTLAKLAPGHPHFSQIRVAQKNIREVWYKRPRFPKERGRVQEEGY